MRMSERPSDSHSVLYGSLFLLSLSSDYVIIFFPSHWNPKLYFTVTKMSLLTVKAL